MRRHFNSLSIAVAALAAPALATIAQGQWSSDSATNLLVGGGTGEQVQPKIVPTSDGGCYVSWYDNSTGGYDVRLQRLDAEGNAQLGANGLLIADRGFSSTQDYGLAVDATDHALLAFRDDRFGGTRITGQRVAPDGMLPWGANGVQFSDGSTFVAAPKIAAATDGDAVIAWTSDSDVSLQRIDPAGNVVWKAPVVLSDPGGANQSLSDLKGGAAGAVIASFIRSTTFSSPKHLYAQNIDAAGAEQWTADGLAVFDGGSLQFGNFPAFAPDGSGGAVFSWYDTASPTLQCYAQRVTAAGAEVFAHNGVATSTNATRQRVSPSAAIDPVTGSTFVFWVETNLSQSQSGVWGQRLDASGVRQWTDDGIEIAALSANGASWVNTLNACGEGVVFYTRGQSLSVDHVEAARLDADGNFVWTTPIVSASTRATDKSRLAATLRSDGAGLAVWQDGASDADILAQNVLNDGRLGNFRPGDLNRDGVVGFADLTILLAQWGCSCCIADIDLSGTAGFADLTALLADWG